MRITFKRIKIKNFMSVGNCPIEYKYNNGLNIVLGKNIDTLANNGSGKTSIILYALTFGLFGRVPSKIVKEDLINSTNKKECEIEIEFQKNKDTYIIRQGIEPRFITIIKNGEEMPSGNTLHIDQSKIKEIIGADYETFLHTIFTCVNYTRPFLELGKAEKRNVIEDILGIGILGDMFEKSHSIFNESKAIHESLYNEIEHLEKIVNERDEHAKNIREQEVKFKVKKKNRLESLKKRYQEINKCLRANEKIITKGKILVNQLPDRKEEKDKHDKAWNKLEKDLVVTKSEITRKKDNIKSLLDSGMCVNCGTSVEADSVKVHISKLEKDIAELENTEVILTQKIDSMKEKSQKIMNLIEKLLEIQKKVDYAKMENKNKTHQQKEVYDKLIELKSEKFEIGNIINNELQEQDKLTLEEKKKTFDTNETTYIYSKVSREILSEKGVKSYIIKQILPFLNKRVNEYLKKLSVQFSIRFDEELNEQITSNFKRDFRYASFSGGEKKRIDLAIMLTLLDISKKQNVIDCNVQILDEVIDTSLDPIGVELFQNILRERIADDPNKCIYIITHRSEINAESYDKIIRVVKEKGFSRIEDEI